MILVEDYEDRSWKYLEPGFHSWEEVSGYGPGDVSPYPDQRIAITKSDEVYIIRSGKRPVRVRKGHIYFGFLIFMTEDE